MDITELEPKKVFGFFNELTKIPRGSGNEKAVSDYLVDFAGKRGLIAYQDDFFNVTILKPATAGMEDKDNVILQAHMDMVCVADKDAEKDPAKHGVDAYAEDGFVKAKGTSLGADDGIGIALILSVLDSDDISHPMIEAVFTADEEVGLGGANGYDPSHLKGKRLINIDTEEENHLVIGCAGGCRCEVSNKCKPQKAEGNIYELTISGLAGGHSGMEIDKGGANANVLMGHLFSLACANVELNIGTYEGGTKDNAICTSATATVVVKKKQGKAFEKIVKTYADEIMTQYCVTDPGLTVKCKDKGKGKLEVMSTKDLRRFVSLLNVLPHGTAKMSQIADMVETSSNIGVVSAKPKNFGIVVSLRSNRDASVEYMITKVETIASAFGAAFQVRGKYPAWQSDGISDFAKNAQAAYSRLFGKEIEIITIHAGLECAVFSQKIKGLDAISIGPDLFDVHTSSEKLSIESTKREWEYLLELLKL
ncbi:MAG: beta-Ala-His dipeptidase [Lachnospiraceae bacterium]|nr:beta-Ala-His dipeptidase [Lachnospiraceae bacterium]